jgi:23S rRNA pseudouridine2605 synthase
LTSEQLEAARSERMRQNGHGTLTFEDARTWIEETGLCLFLPRRQFSSSVAPSFVEAIAGKRDETPDPRHIAVAEELLVRLELEDVAVRLNLQGHPGEQPDFVVASWVLPYVYALRGDRDWRRSPQLTGSRAVSPLAVQTYKLLEAGDATIAQLKQGLGREVSEAGVVRAITELWQQLRIVPVIAAPGQPAKWQLLRHRFQKAIAEGASTSQVTAISVLASIYLQAVIAASMEDVEIFLSPLTARSKVREVLRGLVATRQVHTISLGHAPHFYVAGTLPEFPAATSIYGSGLPASSYYYAGFDHEEAAYEPPVARHAVIPVTPAPTPVSQPVQPVAREAKLEPKPEIHAPRTPVRKPAAAGKAPAARPHSRPAPHARDRKPGTSRPAASQSGSRSSRHGAEARTGNGASRWGKSVSGKSNGSHPAKAGSSSARPKSAVSSSNGASSARPGKSASPAWTKSNGHAKSAKPAGKPAAGVRKPGLSRTSANGSRKPMLTAGAKAGNSKRYGFTARPKQGSKKRG